MRKRARQSKIGLLRELTNGNLGNAAFEAAVVQHIVEYIPDAGIYVSCIDSLETLRSHNVRLFPLNETAYRLSRRLEESIPADHTLIAMPDSGLRLWLKKIPFLASIVRFARAARNVTGRVSEEIYFWARSYRFLKDFQMLIVCGGGQLSDWWGGPWGHPYTLFMWAKLAKISNTRLVILDVGAEQVSSPVSRWFLKSMLKDAGYRSYRDDDTRKAVERWGISDKNHVYPDLAFSLKTSHIGAREPGRIKCQAIGISPMPYCDPRVWPVKDAAAYRRYIGILASFTRALIKRGYTITLFVSQVRMDVTALADLKELIVGSDASLKERIIEPNVRTVDDFLSLMPKLDLVVASRMHGILLSQLMHTPTLALSYESKVDSLMAGFGLADFCLDIRSVETSSLISRFALLESKREVVTNTIARHVAEYRDALERQYSAVFRA